MTTIACNRKGMACDSRIVSAGPISNGPKVEKINGVIWGGAGDAEGIEMFLMWAREGFSKETRPVFPPEDRPEFQMLELNKQGLRIWFSRLVPIPIDEDYYAIGSGSMAAMTALYLGKHPKKAVECAAKFDENTGGIVRWFTL